MNLTKKYRKTISIIMLLSIMLLSLSACKIKIWKQFEDWVKTTDDGFTYYFNDGSKDGVYILDIPDTEELTIPEYIDGNKVVELGHLDMGIGYMNQYCIVGTNTKKLTIQHQFDIREDAPVTYYVDFPNLTNLTFIDFLYCNQSYSENELLVPHYIGKESSKIPVVELKKSDREYSLEDFKAKIIIIPDYVEIIEAGVFDGLTDVTIKTSYETKPDGWEDGWNGSCEVEWGVEIDEISQGNLWNDESRMPENTSLEFWITEDVKDYDWTGHDEIYGWMGAREFLGSGYKKNEDPSGANQYPEHYVSYVISAWPDYADGGQFVTDITITDPAVTVYGLTIASTYEEFDAVFEQLGYELSWGDGAIETRVATKDGITFRLTRAVENNPDVVPVFRISAEITNREGIVF